MKTLWTTLVLALVASASAATDVQETRSYTDETTGLTLIGGSVDLPFKGHWILAPLHSTDGALQDCYLAPPEPVQHALRGRRQGQLVEKREIRRGAYPLRNLYWKCHEYALEHKGYGPPSIEALDPLDDRGTDSHVCYVPGLLLLPSPTNQWERPTDPEVLAFETHPVIDDGKHWVVFSDGGTGRLDIDPDLFAKHGATLVPGRAPRSATDEPPPDPATYSLTARVAAPTGHAHVLSASNLLTGATLDIAWDTTQPTPGDSDLMQSWARTRLGQLAYLSTQANTPVIQHWLSRASALYGLDGNAFAWATDTRGTNRRNRNQQASLFGVLGGRAAIRETLQLQNLAEVAGTTNTSTVSIATLPGVEVKSHPFEEMLAGSAGGRLALANVSPPDRLFAYFAHPKGVLHLLEGGTEFLFNAGSIATRSSLAHGLKDRYFARLGVSESWARTFLHGGAIDELAVIVPDLFLIDGTDLSVVVRVKNPALASAALALIGMGDLSDRTVAQNAQGEPVHWARRGDLLFISTDEAELDRVLVLHATGGIRSLGASAEFRYMLTQLPVEEDTTTLVYFSDPFIRRLVSPGVKIGQLRRLQARAELESLSAAALLYRADGHPGPLELADLLRRGYAAAPVRATDARLAADGTALSDQYGQPARMHSLAALPITRVTSREAEAYKAYRDNYTRFWRRFFDPIGIRINQSGDRTYELTTFILPLIDNSIYQGLRQVLNPAETGMTLAVPTLEPPPVAMLSFNINEEAWLEALDDMTDMLTHLFGLGGGVLDSIGPDVHVAVMDDDPIISFGSGDLAGSFGGLFGGAGSEEMIMIPILGSLLTRPTYVLIGLNDPDAVLHFLRSAALPKDLDLREDWVEASMYQQTGEDRWIYHLSLAGMVNLRYGIEVKGRYLVISNLPLSTDTTVLPGSLAEQCGAQLLLNPAACEQQLASLFASAHENQRTAALEGISYLVPLLWAGAATVDAAASDHARLFGFTPVHPAPGEWMWDGTRLTSSLYGAPGRREQPVYSPGDRSFGMLQQVDQVRLSMQLEQDGLRATARWSLRE